MKINKEEYLELPPISFPKALERLNDDGKIDDDIFQILVKIIENKRLQSEKYEINNIDILNDFIEAQLKIDDAPGKRHYCLPDYFNEVIIPIIHNKSLEVK